MKTTNERPPSTSRPILTRRPKLLVLSSTFPRWRGDTEPPFVYELSRRLTPYFDVTVLAPRAPGSLDHEILDGLTVFRFPYFLRRWENLAAHGGGILSRLRANRLYYLLVAPFLLGQVIALARLMRKYRFDAIHAHWLIPQGLVAIATLWLTGKQIPLFCTSHGGDLFALRSPPMRSLKRLIMRQSTQVSVMSAAMRDEAVALGIPPEKIDIIPMGVDMQQRFTPDSTLPRRLSEILFVGRLVEKKGVEWLLRALPNVFARFPEARLTIAGNGPLEPILKFRASQLGIAHKVDFLGTVAQAELPELYRRATLFVAPFLVAESGDQEGFPLAPLEAIGCGCPIVCGQVAAFGDVIRDGQEALLVPSGNESALASAIARMLSDPELRGRLAANAHRRCHQAFDWTSVSRRYESLLARLAEDV